jgi:hypothetical protein
MGIWAAQNLIKPSLMQECASSHPRRMLQSTELSTQFVDKEKSPVNPGS